MKQWPQWALILAPEFACPKVQLIDLITKQLGRLQSLETISALPLLGTAPSMRGEEARRVGECLLLYLCCVLFTGQSLCSAGQAQCKDHKNLP